jgi:response regulator RpfG family c-di-GMP phosphodiesterase
MTTTRILLVEADQLYANLAASALALDGFGAVEQRHSAMQAAARLREGGVDLVVVACDLPDAPGEQALGRIRELAPQVPVIALVRPDHHGIGARPSAGGPIEFLLKDEALSALLPRVVRHVLENHRLQGALTVAERHQAAITLENAALLARLQSSNSELAVAYDATLEGWSRALDLRDQETEGHTQRVTEETLRLALHLGVGHDELVHMRRGAILHDIGKMAIPDAILLKPGRLTEAEWAIMRSHPTLAYELLSPIAYLAPALAIPYCHHEKWNGSGYPRGLSGEQIPFAARIFAVADVWDALSFDRPYRRAWPAARVRDHIASQAGTHFDPRVVVEFLRRRQPEAASAPALAAEAATSTARSASR